MKNFSGTIIKFYCLDQSIYAVAEEYENGTIVDREGYSVDSMTDAELQQLISAGGVFTEADTDIPKQTLKTVLQTCKDIAMIVVTDEAVELQHCDKKYARLRKAFGMK